MLTLRVRTSLAPRLAGFTVPARSTRDKSHGRTFLTWCSGQYSCPASGRRIVCRCVPFCFIPGSDVVRSSISFLLLAPDAWARGCGPWFTLPSVACPVGRFALVLSLRIFFVKSLLSSWYRGLRCACARSCVAPASGLWFLGASLPSTGFVVALQVWYCPVLLA